MQIQTELQEAFEKLNASLLKQYGTIPTEIQGELDAIEILLNPIEVPPVPELPAT